VATRRCVSVRWPSGAVAAAAALPSPGGTRATAATMSSDVIPSLAATHPCFNGPYSVRAIWSAPVTSATSTNGSSAARASKNMAG
jgi:hypothetical protein